MKRQILTLGLMASFVASTAAAQGTTAGVKVFRGARIIDGTGRPAIERGAIVIRAGRIEQVGPSDGVRTPGGAEQIDVSGKTIIPGLINSHGHVGEARGLESGPQQYTEENVLGQLGLYARYGLTTVFSLGGDRELALRLRSEQDAPGLKRARIYVAGPVITGKTPEEARHAVDRVAAMKVDFVKIRVDDNLGTTVKMPPEVYRAVIERAHHHKLPLAAHLFYLDDARLLLEAGADLLAHSVRDRDIDQATIALLKKRDVCLCPTLTREVSTFVYESRPAFFDDPFFLREADPQVMNQLLEPKRQEAMRNSSSAQRYKAALEVASRNLKKLVDSGVRIAFGTDTGPPARFQGYFEHMEMDLMAKAGLTPMQILKSATGDAARCMKASGKIGTLEPGAWADLLVLEKNPLDDIRNVRTIQSVWIAGERLPAPAKALDYEFFKTRVQPIFLHKRKGHARCVSCHSGRTGFALASLSPGATIWNESQSRQNYRTASQLVVPGEPAASRLLMHPLSAEAGGDPYHSGGQHWYSQTDPEWQTLADWVRSGASETSTTAQVLDFDFYRTRVEPIFLNPRQGGGAAAGGVGCFACHTILATPLRLQPLAAGSKSWTEEQSRRNFEAVARLVVPGEPLQSRLLLQPLATEAGGTPRHTGGKFWTSQNDPEFLILSEWVRRRR